MADPITEIDSLAAFKDRVGELDLWMTAEWRIGGQSGGSCWD